MSADLKQSAFLRQSTPGLHALTESTPDNVLSDQPHLVTSRPTEFLLCLPQTNRVVEMSLGSNCSGVQAEGF